MERHDQKRKSGANLRCWSRSYHRNPALLGWLVGDKVFLVLALLKKWLNEFSVRREILDPDWIVSTTISVDAECRNAA